MHAKAVQRGWTWPFRGEADLSDAPSPFAFAAGDLRRSQVEVRTYVEALAQKLEQALPDRTSVERRREGLFAKTQQVAKLTFRGDRAVYELSLGKAQVIARKAKVVRGIAISSTELAPPQWLAELGAEVRELAQATGAASDALLDFL
ncbi:MAG: hypothetical protein JF588_23310 [Caulobacterales bacterium]|nr:hypothetical protein [Caulobacterales bacterium]